MGENLLKFRFNHEKASTRYAVSPSNLCSSFALQMRMTLFSEMSVNIHSKFRFCLCFRQDQVRMGVDFVSVLNLQ
jgi:hypothetical protein